MTFFQTFKPTDSESKVIDGAAKGDLVDLSAEQDQAVRGELLVFLCTSTAETSWTVHPRGVNLRAADVTGELDFHFLAFQFPLTLSECVIEKKLLLQNASAKTIALTGCRVPGIDGADLEVKGSLLLNDGFQSDDEVVLIDARIDGRLGCRGGTFSSRSGVSINCNGMHVGGTVFMDRGFRAEGKVRLRTAQIDGQLVCDGGTFRRVEDVAIDADNIVVKGDATLRLHGSGDEDLPFSAEGEVRLPGASIGGKLLCTGGRFTHPMGRALYGDGISVGGDFCMNEGFRASGEVQLLGARIGRTLNCENATFDSEASSASNEPSDKTRNASLRIASSSISGSLTCIGSSFERRGVGLAVNANGIEVKASVQFRDGFSAVGQVDLTGAQIGEQIQCDGASFKAQPEDGIAITADGAKIGLDVHLRHGFKACGGVQLIEAELGGQLDCRGGTFHRAPLPDAESQTSPALNAAGISVKTGLWLDRSSAVGEVRFCRAEIGAQLSCVNATLKNGGGTAFDGSDVTVGGALHWAGFASRPAGKVDLSSANVKELRDDNQSWPTIAGQLMLEGFTYETLGGDGDQTPGAGGERTVGKRIEWLELQRPFSPQPYQELCRVYRDAGRRGDARKVAIAKEKARRKTLGSFGKLWSLVTGATVAHGQRPWQALWCLAVFVAGGSLLFWHAQEERAMLPTKIPSASTTAAMGDRAVQVSRAQNCSGDYVCFQPVVYSLDAAVPLVNLQQRDAWAPDAQAPWGWAYRTYVWIVTILGWLLATLVVAGATGLLSKD